MTVNEMKGLFIDIYGESDNELRVFASPGRVNLIGEHTDYCGGYVLPAALTMDSTIVCRVNGEDMIRLAATDLPDRVAGSLDELDAFKDVFWGNYQMGVAKELKEAGYPLVGVDMLFHDTIPHGGGLSSSAAIEVSTAVAMATLGMESKGMEVKLDMVELARIGQKTEHNYCGVKCGIMDQFASAMGKAGHAIFLNCRTLEYEHVPIVMDGYKIVVSNTKVKRSLATSKYNERRAECEEGLKNLQEAMPGKTCLGEISYEEFCTYQSYIKNETVKKRVEHVISEDDRVLRSVRALQNNDIAEFGRLINQSGDSLRYFYEVTGEELDTMVDAARKVEGVIGTRMTGAGFGGCTVSIVKSCKVDEFIARVGKEYEEKIGIKPEFYVSETGDGGRELK